MSGAKYHRISVNVNHGFKVHDYSFEVVSAVRVSIKPEQSFIYIYTHTLSLFFRSHTLTHIYTIPLFSSLLSLCWCLAPLSRWPTLEEWFNQGESLLYVLSARLPVCVNVSQCDTAVLETQSLVRQII